MAKALVRVEVVWPAEVVGEVGVRAAAVGGAPAVLAAPERAPVGGVLRAAALLVPPLGQRAQVVVGGAPGVTFVGARSLSGVERGDAALCSLLPKAWDQGRGAGTLSFLIEGGPGPIPQ